LPGSRTAAGAAARDPTQEPLVAAMAIAGFHEQILRQCASAPSLQLVETDHSGEHLVHSPRRQPRRFVREHDNVLCWSPSPGGELRKFHNTDLIPTQAALVRERPERPQTVRIRLDRVRRPLAIGQPRQILVDGRHRPAIRSDHGERLAREGRQETRRTVYWRVPETLTSQTSKTP